MTARATLRHAPSPFPGWSRLVVDCPHGTTISDYVTPASGLVTGADVVRATLERHDAEEGCRCTRRLWRTLLVDAPAPGAGPHLYVGRPPPPRSPNDPT